MAEAPQWANDAAAVLALAGTLGVIDAGYALINDVQSTYELAFGLAPGRLSIAEGLVGLAMLCGAFWFVLKYEDKPRQ
ncbi:MAG: hypothetical protein AAB955_03865 [Patescibacteria group bacterium]